MLLTLFFKARPLTGILDVGLTELENSLNTARQSIPE
jgi:hypothetical protein